MDIVAGPKEVEMLSNLDFVEWIEHNYPTTLDNEVAAQIIGAEWVSIPSNMLSLGGALTGEGVIVAVMDSGLDTAVECSSISNCASLNSGIHQDFVGRLSGVVSYAPSSCSSNCDPGDNNGHGTHVAGSIVGDGGNSEDGVDNSGMAPSAYLFMQSVGYGSSDGTIMTPGYANGFSDAYAAGARVSSNSWGRGPDFCANDAAGAPGQSCWTWYSGQSMSLDSAAYNYPDLAGLFSMGNDGRDCYYTSYATDDPPNPPVCPGGKNGEINIGAMNQQANAKNIIAVGASESARSNTGISLYDRSYSSLYGGVYYGNPINGDKSADTNLNDFSTEGMWANSNRGPAEDGRIKPDIVAPGSMILSTRSELAADRPGEDMGDYYTVKSGTSMATPITAGAVALLIEYLNNYGYDCNLAISPSSNNCPDAALMKGILAASAHDMNGQYSSGGDGQNGAVEKTPNEHEGWGRVDLQTAIGSPFTEGIEITTLDSHSFKLSVPDTGLSEMRIALSWHEQANSASSSIQLRNDLDIQIISPTGDIEPYTNDAVNNLLAVTVESPDAGDWQIIVTGEQVIDGSQKYFLAASDGVITDMRSPVSENYNEPGFQSGSIFTETTMSAGGDHICAILDDASLQCWGENLFGQLGDGTTTDR